MDISVKLIEAENEVIATCPELEINCYGASKSEAVRRIKNVIQFYLTSAKELGLDVESFDKIIIDGKSSGAFELDDCPSASSSVN